MKIYRVRVSQVGEMECYVERSTDGGSWEEIARGGKEYCEEQMAEFQTWCS